MEDAHIEVILYNSTTQVETILTLATHYTLVGAGVSAGGTLTMLTAPSSVETLTIIRNVDYKQEVDLVENASYGVTVCAERSAVCTAVSSGDQDIQTIAVMTKDGGSPCGTCRQMLYEFNPEMLVILLVLFLPRLICLV